MASINAEILVGYDFDADARDYREASEVISGLDASNLTSPMDISHYSSGGDNSGLDASAQPLGDAGTLGGVAIQIFDATTDSFADAVLENNYVTFTVTPNDKYTLNFSSITFKASKQSAISVDEYAVTDELGNLIGSSASITNEIGVVGTFDGVSIDLSDATFQNLTAPVTFRIYAWGRGSDSGSGSLAILDKVVLNGRADPNILAAYDFNSDSLDPSSVTLVDDALSASQLTSPMGISYLTDAGDNTGQDAFGSSFGESNVLGAVAIQVTDATTSGFEQAVLEDDYLSFIITPNIGGAHLTSLGFKVTKNAEGSVDEYVIADALGNAIGSPTVIFEVVGLTGAYEEVRIELGDTDYEYITEPTEFRIYAWGRGTSNVSGTVAALDKVTLYGSTFELGSDYYVSNSGSDANDGTFGSPFSRIQHAVGEVGPGSTIYIREGTYHEEIDLSGVFGTPNFPVVITPYNGEEVTLDGTVPIDTTWTLDTAEAVVLPDGNDTPVGSIPGIGNVYVSNLNDSVGDISQLFVDSKIMTLARFPNALVWSEDFWSQRTKKSNDSTRGNIFAEDIVGEAGVSFTGCGMLFNFENYGSEVSHVTAHTAGSTNFQYASRGGWRTSDNYFFEGGIDNAERVMLDMAQEWAYDESTGNLYLWADDGLNPAGREISGKVQTYAIVGDASTKNVVIDGLDFFATTFKFEHSDGISIRNCNNDYPSCSDRALGSAATPDAASIHGDIDDWCKDIVLYNNTFRYADGAGLLTSYMEDALVENNLFEYINYTCVSGKAVQLAGTRNLVCRHNTLRDTGPSAGFSIGRLYIDDDIYPYIFEYNLATGCSRMQDDGTAYYAVGGNATEAVTRYNWAIDNRQRDFRWDGNNNPLTGIWCNLYRNVSRTTQWKPVNLIGGAYKLKGDFHEIYNNIAVQARGDFEVSIGNGGNASSRTYNNAGDYLSGDTNSSAVPGDASNNFAAQDEPRNMSLLLRDYTDLDFRPKWDAVELIDQGVEVTCTFNNGETVDVTEGYNGEAPDIGVYEYGDEDYWIPGYRYPQASTPIPANGNLAVAYDVDLMWLGGLGAVSYNIYVGTSEGDLVSQGNQANNIYTQAWVNDQTYYWRVDSILADDSVVAGEVWSFAVNDHTPRAYSQRLSVEEDRSVSFTLSGFSPDENAFTYNVTGQPTYGTLSGTAPSLVYTPLENFSGVDSINFTVNDGAETSGSAIVIFEVMDDEADTPYFYLASFSLDAATVGNLYTSSIADSAADFDEHSLSYSILDGPSWLDLALGGTVSGTPSFSDLGMNQWIIRVEDSTGLWSTASLEIRVVEEGITLLSFTDLDNSFDANTLNVDGSNESLSVTGAADDNDYLYSVIFTGSDYDGDTFNDTLSFDVRVQAWNNSVTNSGVVSDGVTNSATATIGSNDAVVFLTGLRFSVGDSKMNGDESLEFSIENLNLSLTRASQVGSANSSGFDSARLEQTSTTGNSHQAIFGAGSDLLGVQFPSGLDTELNVGSGSLYISSANGGGTRSTSWAVADVGFNIEVVTAAQDSYTGWALGYGLDSTTMSPLEDIEYSGTGDGHSNFLEFSLGTDPTLWDAGEKISYYSEMEGNTAHFIYKYDRRTDYLDLGINYNLFVTSNMENALNVQPFDVQISIAEGLYETVITRYLMDVPKLFIQLDVGRDN
ncbi:MAG: Ig-like domain-containing protein [Akkermansiaceae bacterium]